MAEGKRNKLEHFVYLFNKLKNAAKNDPQKLEVFYKQNSRMKKAADDLFFFVSFGDFERRVFHGGSKYIPQSPEGFSREWKEYKEIWSGSLFDCIFEIDLDELISVSADKTTNGNSTAQREIELESPDPDFDDEFNPLLHDGGKAFDMAFWITQNYAEEVGTEFEDTIHKASRIGLDAYDYLQNTIGFDASDVFRRWRQIPIVFMPAHVSNKHGLTERGSIYELIEDAVRAYVFGAPAAAIAMCRAVLEMILKEHYDIDYQYRDKKTGEIRDKGLSRLIVLADERYNFIQGNRLRRLSDKANKIMHKYASTNKLTVTDEKIILDFFKTNKFLLERAPGKK